MRCAGSLSPQETEDTVKPPPHKDKDTLVRRVELIHIDIPEFTADASDGLPLLNFSDARHRMAAELPIGCRILIWVRQRRAFWAEVELTGTLADGDRLCRQHGFVPGQRHMKGWGNLYRPIRFLNGGRRNVLSSPLAAVETEVGSKLGQGQPADYWVGDDRYEVLRRAIRWS
jgi:hypothetical protein